MRAGGFPPDRYLKFTCHDVRGVFPGSIVRVWTRSRGGFTQPVREDAMRRGKLIKIVLVATLVVFPASYAFAEEFFARLDGFQEIGALPTATAFPTGALLSKGSGTLRLSLDSKAGTARFTLTYSDVGTTAPKTGTVTQAHIHFGKRHVAGGVMVFFCATPPAAGPAGTPTPCPDNSGTVTGTFTSASV